VDAYDDPDAAADLAVYREQFGLPTLEPGQFRKVNQQGFPGDYPAGDPSWATEISLDLDMISALAPKADIILVEADSATEVNLGTAVNEAVALGGRAGASTAAPASRRRSSPRRTRSPARSRRAPTPTPTRTSTPLT
jgi:hypothetical protein